MNTVVLRPDESKMFLPRELFEAMETPQVIQVRPERGYIDRFFLFKRPRGIHHRLRHAAGALLERWSPATLVALEPDRAVFRYDKAPDFRSSEYRIVNYHPGYYLMAADDEQEHRSRESEWKNLQSYNEHLPVAAQDPGGSRVSDWLAEQILKPLQPRSVLEVGCGAGRNLYFIDRHMPDVSIAGIDINEDAIRIARQQLGAKGSALAVGSLYDLHELGDQSIDVVFTSGVLMHVPHEKVQGVVRELWRIARRAVVHFELHGPSHGFDFHRYPRDYAELYRTMQLPMTSYDVFPGSDFRSRGTASFNHALLVSAK